MIGPDRLDRVSVEAVVPEQVVAYVRAVAGSTPRLVGSCVGYQSGNRFVLVGYPLHDPFNSEALDESVVRSLAIPGIRQITVIGPVRPSRAPADARSKEDAYQALSLPAKPPGQKLRNLLRRAGRDLSIDKGRRLESDHLELVQQYLENRLLADETRQIFARISDYVAASPTSLVVSARRPDGKLASFGVGEYVSYHTAFFVFCFRNPQTAPPGSVDFVLAALLAEAEARGQTRMNLGLGISEGIRFFKKKWGGEVFLPNIEVSWEVRPPRVKSHRRFLAGDKTKEASDDAKKKPEDLSYPSLRGPGIWESLKELLLGRPRTFDCIQVEVSSRCAARCGYCPHTAMKDSWLGQDMAMETFVRLWPLMRCTGRVHLQGWGEPLFNPDFFEMVSLARRAGCNVSTTTCGLQITAKTARRIVDSGLDIIAFSLAGTDSASNASRHGADFDRVCAAIAELQRVRKERGGVHLEIHIAYLLLASNLDAVRGLPLLMQRLGVHATVISTLDYIPRTDLASEAILATDTAKIERAEAVLSETAAEARRLELEFHYALPDAAAPGNRCRENISRTLFVSAGGLVSPCVYSNVPASVADPDRRVFGNLSEQDPLDIWAREDFCRFRDALSTGRPQMPCRSCPKRFMT